MERCNGRMHYEMTDSYSNHSYPCPGPPECINQPKETNMPSPSLIAQQEEADTTYPHATSEYGREGQEDIFSGYYEPMADYPAEPPSTVDLIREVCDEIKELLVTKNEAYGDSAVDPVRIFSRSDTDEQLRVRIDDKLSRLARGDERIESDGEVVNDLIGYLILLRVSARR